MDLLKKRILQDGKCFEGGILKVDSFINHQMDPILMKSIGVEFVRRFADKDFNKVMTIEASGIAPAIGVSFGNARGLRQEKATEDDGKYDFNDGTIFYKRPGI